MAGTNRRPGRRPNAPHGSSSCCSDRCVAAAAAVALLLGPVGSASAHDALVGSTPAADGTVDTAPASVSLEFSDAPQSLGTEVVGHRARRNGGLRRGAGDRGLHRHPAAGRGLPAGTYTVDWRVTSADGHPLTGSFAFDVTRDAPAAGTPPYGVAAASSESSSFPVVWIVIALIAAGAVVLVVRQLRRPA